MSKIERVKTEIAFREKLFFAALAIVVALVGWAAQHYVAANATVLLLCIFVLLAVSVFGARNYLKIKQLWRDLENE